MKILSNVIQMYQILCPVSTNKCESYSEIEYKIVRAVNLGTVIQLNPDGSVVYGYYNLQFTVKNNKVIDMNKNKINIYIKINEYVKFQYDVIHNKMVI